jgi:tetratricopeptide (TPR) repeat protein
MMVRLLVAAALVSAPAAAAQQPAPVARLDTTAVRQWREDLAHLARELPRRHRNVYHTTPRPVLDSAFAELDRRLPSLARHQVILELARLVALVGDGHTNVAPTRDSLIGFRAYPVKLYFFHDGLFVRAARGDHADLAGARVVRIGTATPEEAFALVRELIGRDNDMGARFFAPFLLAMPEVLHGLGLVPDMERAEWVVEQGGRRRRVVLRPAGLASMMPADTDVSWAPDSGWADMRDAAGAGPPLWLRGDPRRHFRLEWLPESGTLYLQYNKVGDEPGETVEAFAARVLALLDTARVQRAVLDLRLNRGGNGALNTPLLVALVKARRLDQPGRLFLAIGRGTFSAAQFLVHDLEDYTNAVFVGEPTGSKPNHFGDSRKITLPNSGITVRASIYYWQRHPLDRRPWKAPDVTAELTSAEYRAGIDPVLREILAYRPEPPIAARMREAFAAGDDSLALRRYRAYRADPRHAYADTEAGLNALGYELLRGERPASAVRVFELSVAEHPASSNAFDSLGEGYLRAGRREEAIRSYRRSLELDPENGNAAAQLRALGARP